MLSRLILRCKDCGYEFEFIRARAVESSVKVTFPTIPFANPLGMPHEDI